MPDINTLEPLANALDISVFELMRSEKADMGKEKRSISESDAAQLMEHAVEMASENQRRDKVSLWVGGAVLFVIAVLAKMSGHANLGGSLFIRSNGGNWSGCPIFLFQKQRRQRKQKGLWIFPDIWSWSFAPAFPTPWCRSEYIGVGIIRDAGSAD